MENQQNVSNITYLEVETFIEKSYTWPGTSDNPTRQVYATNPFTGEEVMVHYNDRNLHSDEDYKNAGFVYHTGRGWCWPFTKQLTQKNETITTK